jgi:MarR family transcriptional regulator, organic hydroperoxide resistance regulator
MAKTAPQPSLGLEEQLCFALYAASRTVTARYRPLLDDLGLTYPQYLVMLVLWEHGTVSVRELGRHLQLDSGTLSPLLKRLEAAGVLTRRRSVVDERSVDISPTPSGEELRERARTVPPIIAAATGLDDTELATLQATLEGLTQRMAGDARDVT